jgi:hypothetical protein
MLGGYSHRAFQFSAEIRPFSQSLIQIFLPANIDACRRQFV